MWKQNQLASEYQNVTDFGKFASQLRMLIWRSSQHSYDAVLAKSPIEEQSILMDLQIDLKQLHEKINEIHDEQKGFSSSYKATMVKHVFEGETGLTQKLSKYIEEASSLLTTIQKHEGPDPMRATITLGITLNEIVNSLDSLIGQTSLLTASTFQSLKNAQFTSMILILLLIIGVAGYIIYPTSRLLHSQQKAHEEALKVITERTAHLEIAKHQAEAASRSKSEFLSNISHEIRTPMTAILGYADMLLLPKLSSDEQMKNIQIIRRNVSVLMRLIDDVLDISKIESGRQILNITKSSLPELVSEAYSLLNSRAQEKNLQFNVVFIGNLPKEICTDIIRLRQILINLLGNAIKFTERGEVRLTVRYRKNFTQKSQLEFVVSDTGCGISKEATERLFGTFTQVDPSSTRRFGGTGLGLALSQRLAKALGGDVVLLTTTPGIGTTFVATIDPGPVPLDSFVNNMSVVNFIDSNKRLPILPQRGLEGIRVLVVEDSTENRELFCVFLEQAGAKTSSATNGEEGVQKALMERPDIILMDIQMPKMDGYEATTTLRNKNYNAPIIALTAHAMPEERERCSRSGFDSYLSKPVDAEVLVETVQSIAERSKHTSKMLNEQKILSASTRIRSIFEKFCKSIPQQVTEIRLACQSKDWEKVLDLTHRFKGTASNCGFTQLKSFTEEIEVEVKKENYKGIFPLMDKLESLGRLSQAEFNRLGQVQESQNG